ncbi:hypothetical protein IW262DRAFT_1460735 [Armillaria fumosa]|nr:hypothetical protein IW262DRAFT_1460735 [Armillaria fumosa]
MSFAMDWAYDCHAFIKYNYNYYSVFLAFMDKGSWWRASFFVGGITGGISTLLVDVTIIWRCWMLWDCQWKIVLLPIICAIAATIMKTMQLLSDFLYSTHDISSLAVLGPNIDWSLIYAVLSLTTNLICTLLMVYKIIRFAQRLFLFQRIISALIETCMLYTLALIVYLALVSRNTLAANYAAILVAYIRNIVPTLLVLSVAASPTSNSSEEESTASRPISDINFQPMEENSIGSDNTSDQSFAGSHRTGTTESV